MLLKGIRGTQVQNSANNLTSCWSKPVENSIRRKEMYWEMQQIVRDEGGVIIPMIANMVDAASDK
jgi:hypothetical protein